MNRAEWYRSPVETPLILGAAFIGTVIARNSPVGPDLPADGSRRHWGVLGRRQRQIAFQLRKGKTMKSKLMTIAAIVGALSLPLAGYAADDKDSDRSSPKAFVKDSVITAKIKANMAADKQVSAITKGSSHCPVKPGLLTKPPRRFQSHAAWKASSTSRTRSRSRPIGRRMQRR